MSLPTKQFKNKKNPIIHGIFLLLIWWFFVAAL